ncbi:MAG: DUF2309 domain-containing protein [Alphaproteobacteria bacterium]|nr:DUF2309 domain-containing protein [Alphaproteobacteria bacterium]
MNTQNHDSAEASVLEMVEHAAHLLPGQRPIESFVHHNPLHHYEHLSFEDAVLASAARAGATPWMSEQSFREQYVEGRVLDRDLDEALSERVPDAPLGIGSLPVTERELVRRLMLFTPADVSGQALRWRLAETQMLRALPEWTPRDAKERILEGASGSLSASLSALWTACEVQRQGALAALPAPPVSPRPRDRMLEQQGRDPDLLVHPVLIRWCLSFLDHGQSHWPMPDRGEGFYMATLRLLATGATPMRGWMRPLRRRARQLLDEGASASTTSARCLQEMRVPEDRWQETIDATLLAMRGFPGMFVQLGARPDLAPGRPAPTPLVDFLAVRLLLDQAALTHAPEVPRERSDRLGMETWRLFNAALLMGLHVGDLQSDALAKLQTLVERWPREAREPLWHLAYERRYRMQILDSLGALHARSAKMSARKARAQVVTCIDDREESLRRHLEELDPAWETFGAAGSYNIAMAYRGLGDVHPQPLCAAGVVPRHLVEARPLEGQDEAWARTQKARSRSASVGWASDEGARSLLAGSLITLAGIWSLIPLTARLLSPAAHAEATHHHVELPTRLTLEFDPSEPEKDGYQLGYKVEEMVDIVCGLLRGMGLVEDFAPLVALLGHGSTSRNNPHEAAHDCGACGGGRGGPNARAFAAMANRADVREALRGRGVKIPDGTWFIGGYHNTANDVVEWYDVRLLPETHSDTFAHLRADMDEARRRDAHERCRRFESAPLGLTPEQALRHVEDRAEDLAQPRPEYGHATNALCFIGRRSWSRGLFLDRRVFLTSYDSRVDNADGELLEGLLATLGPVGAGINLEYWFSFVDPERYGSGTKLPHNISGLVGVMNGSSSDLRTGLPWQMVEIHEPMRLLLVVEAKPETVERIVARRPDIRQLVANRWILFAAFDPDTGEAWYFGPEGLTPHTPETRTLPEVETSAAWYAGRRGHLSPAIVRAGLPEART